MPSIQTEGLVLKPRAARNRTLECSASELELLTPELCRLFEPIAFPELQNRIINQDLFEISQFLPVSSVDLLILDPPYNLSKDFHGKRFTEKSGTDYQAWFSTIVQVVRPTLKPNASIYVCADWKTSMQIAPVLEREFSVRNRITWEREKGRGAVANWKNTTEDIWFCTVSETYCFNTEAVKLKRRVLAPYRAPGGAPKDWQAEDSGKFRLTHPSNSWTDVTVPFWSMSENTDHPTQKPEKLIAKLVLASSNSGDVVFDPFLGSGTSAVVARKLGRSFFGVEQNTEYCCWALKRLAAVEAGATAIQGYAGGVFWERNSRVVD